MKNILTWQAALFCSFSQLLVSCDSPEERKDQVLEYLVDQSVIEKPFGCTVLNVPRRLRDSSVVVQCPANNLLAGAVNGMPLMELEKPYAEGSSAAAVALDVQRVLTRESKVAIDWSRATIFMGTRKDTINGFYIVETGAELVLIYIEFTGSTRS